MPDIETLQAQANADIERRSQALSGNTSGQGDQRLPIERLQQFEALRFGMFIHYSMNTYEGVEHSLGQQPASAFCPDQLDVDQWVRVARDTGMTYAVLTAKHDSGFALWPTTHSSYSVASAGNTTDIVDAFISACQKYGIKPGLYYCTWDCHNHFNSAMPSFVKGRTGKPFPYYLTRPYIDFQLMQTEELLTRYGPVETVWIDIPYLLRGDGRQMQYDQIVSLCPDTTVTMNCGFQDGTDPEFESTWPLDVVTLEQTFPKSTEPYNPWKTHELSHGQSKQVYVPGEFCDSVSYDWFWNDLELLGIVTTSTARGVNCLLNVPPDRHGVIPDATVNALKRLRQNLDRVSWS